jgi:hypothetical protein
MDIIKEKKETKEQNENTAKYLEKANEAIEKAKTNVSE